MLNRATFVDCLVYNNRFATAKISADQVGAESLNEWKTLVNKLRQAAYDVYVHCENNDLSVESTAVDKTAVYNALRAILAELGEVNGHKLLANEELATLVVGYSGKRANKDSVAMGLVKSKIANTTKLLREYKGINGVNPDAIKAMEADLEKLEAEKAELLAQPDNRIKEPTRVPEATFRLDLEHKLARVIADQKAMTWDELEERDRKIKEDRKNKNKQRKAEKKAAEAQAQA